MAAGDRNLVRNAICAYFGGTLVATDAGIAYQGGPLVTSNHLSTCYPYAVKGVPEPYHFTGQAAGAGWGAVLGITRVRRHIGRWSSGGATSGWRRRDYNITCEIEVISFEPHVETAEQGLDDLIDALTGLIFADRTLGTTNPALYPNPPYPDNRLIIQAGEGGGGDMRMGGSAPGIDDETTPFVPLTADERGKYGGVGTLTFQATTVVAS